jgi:transcription initiation factor TFIIIB Brf1 subunit/transcription initiation factor TFIIB
MTDRGRPELSYKERVTRYRGLGRIQQLVDAMNQSETVGDEAESVFVDAHRADLLHGRGTALGAAAAVVLSGRLEGTPITADAVAPYCYPSADEIRTARRAFGQELDLQFRHPTDHLHQLGEAFDLDDGTLDEAASLIDRAAEQGLVDNKSPEGVAAGALLHATEELGITSVGETTKVSTATIRKRRDEMQERFELL